MIDSRRIRELNDEPVADGAFVLYWMQQSQRASFNHALEYAIRSANGLGQSVVVTFGLKTDYPEANARHYAFMLEGLRDVERQLKRRRIKLVVRRGAPDEVALDVAARASLVVCDRGYLRHQRQWRRNVARQAGRRTVEVEGDVVVPIEAVSDKREYAARTLRPKLHRHRDDFLTGLEDTIPDVDSRRLRISGDVDVSDPEALLADLEIDHSVAPARRLEGGTRAARRRLTAFLRGRLSGYEERRNEPGHWHTSMLSPYLHFGQISPVEVARKVQRATSGSGVDRAAFLEEMLVRRELAANFVFYEPDYDAYGCLPDWARETLAEHRVDEREHVYTRSEMETAATHDRYWNAAMKEMAHTGFMHNYMRMYWGKKILEWCRTPEYAFRTALYLNNKYFLDGRDASSFANVAWCFGLHDRGWPERQVFGKVRYMNARGLERKFDMDRYVAGVDALLEAES